MKNLVFGLTAVLCPLLAQQPASVVTRAGYAAAQPIKVAPGQVITLFVRPAQIQVNEAVAAPGIPLPVTMNGFTVQLRQTLSQVPIAVPILSLNPVQTCSAVIPVSCSAQVAMTVQIPFELVPNVRLARGPANFATLTVFEHGIGGDPLPLDASPDAVHLINSCDTTKLTVDAPCRTVIAHADGTEVSSDSPAHANETLTITAYGLGRSDQVVRTGDASPDPASGVSEVRAEVRFGMNLESFQPNADASAASAVLKAGSVGIYQVTFTVPELPGDLPACGDIDPNAKVSVGRGASFDSAGFCVR